MHIKFNPVKQYSAKYYLLFILLAYSVKNFAQPGLIKGVVKDKTTNETLIGVNVIIEGTNIGAVTDLDGQYTIQNLKSGKYKIKVEYISYEPFLSDEITINASETINYDIFLSSASINLTTVNVVASKKTGNDVAVINTIKGSVSVANGISSQLISKTQDKDAAEVVKRIPGITVIDDKYIIVRGLPQRYNTVWLNGAATPSSDADNKAFSFDVIPSSMIDNIMVYKTAQADFPADYSGGFIKIGTKAFPEENSIVFSYSTSMNQGTTFKDFYKYQGSKTDWLGYDNGFRSLPDEMPSNLQEYNNSTDPTIQGKVNDIGKSMNKSWEPKQQIAIPDQKFLIGISKKFDKGNVSFGNFTALTYSYAFDYNDIEINNTYSTYNYALDQVSVNDEYHDSQNTNTAKIGFIHNWAFRFNPKNKIEFRNLLNQIGYTRSTLRDGREWYNDGRYIKANNLNYVSRFMYTGQLGGTHTLKKETTIIDWTLGYSVTNRKEPDDKRYRYVRDEADTTIYTTFFPENGDLSSQSRMWLSLEENLLSSAFNFTKQLNLTSINIELKSGAYYEKKDRAFSARNFGYGTTGSTFRYTNLNPELIYTDANFNLTDGIKLIEFTNNSDSYTAGSEIQAAYLMFKIPISKFDINLGLRAERSIQSLDGYRTGTAIKVNPVRDTLNFFPSLNLIYNITDKHLLRFAYGKTVNRPEFREMAPFYFVDFDLNAGIYGNDTIKQAYINNYDLRFEYYPSPGEMITLGAFYKELTDAIEFITLGNSPTQYSFTNVASSYNYGIELEFKKDLDFIGLKNFSATFNGSIIKSLINSGVSDLSRERPLQGQSPYIVNAGLFYQNDKSGLMANIVYNIIGKRIVAVGRPLTNQWEDIPDTYENPRNLVDINLSKKIGRYFEIKVGIKDLINQKVEFSQNVKTDVDMSYYGGSGIKYFDRTQVSKLYYPGRIFTMGVNIKI